MAGRLPRTLELARTMLRLGPGYLAGQFRHRAALKLGVYQRALPAFPWEAYGPVEGAKSPFRLVDVQDVPGLDANGAIARADRIGRGELPWFCDSWIPIPERWDQAPGRAKWPEGHWTSVRGTPACGDIKAAWDPSRFGFAYDLARAYSVTGDACYPAAFADLLANWRTACPPMTGVAWSCGQESSYRLFALVFAAGVFGGSQEIWQTVAALARRIEVTIGYAIAQGNNHALSEATALALAGTCLPEHPSAVAWRQRGERVFNDQIVRQILPDGGHVLQSANYQRVVLRDALFFEKVGRLTDSARVALARAARFLASLVDPQTGAVPHFGPDDGSLIAPLDGLGYDDFRPAAQTAMAAFGGGPFLPPGPWDEDRLWWGFGASEDDPLPALPPLRALDTGIVELRQGENRVFVRCPSGRLRPYQADAMSLEAWVGGQHVLIDPGTCAYAGEEEAEAYVSGSRGHNTLTVGGEDPMRKAGPFLWLDWTAVRTLGLGDDFWEGEAEAYPGVSHRRRVSLGDALIVEDRFIARDPCDVELRWHTAGPIEIDAPPGFILAEEQGWRCPRYGQKVRTPVQVVRGRLHGEATIRTRIAAPATVSRSSVP